jgi:membrane-associated phospholipid phosphatase
MTAVGGCASATSFQSPGMRAAVNYRASGVVHDGRMNATAATALFAKDQDVRRSRGFFDARSMPVYGMCLAGATIVAVAIGSGRFAGDPVFFASIVQSCSPVLLFAYAARWIGFPRLANPIEQAMTLLLSAMILALCSVIFASANAPVADARLRWIDEILLGFDRARFIATMAPSPASIRLWAWIYNSLAYTPIVALVLLNLSGRSRHAWVLVTALVATAFVCIACAATVPAYGTPPFPYDFEGVLSSVRDGSLRTLSGSVITGIVTFPSMHAADAVILICAFRWLGRWAAPLLVLNLLMFMSALVVGGHYMIDLLVGGAVGGAVLYGSLRLHGLASGIRPQNDVGGSTWPSRSG